MPSTLKTFLICTAIFISPVAGAQLNPTTMQTLRQQAERGELDAALQELQKVAQKATGQRRLVSAAKAGLFMTAGRWAEAENELRDILKATGRTPLLIKDILLFQLGRVLFEQKKWNEARDTLAAVVTSDAPQAIRIEAQIYRIRSAIALGQPKLWSPDLQQVERLKKKLRNSELYPSILEILMNTDKLVNRTASACKSARELYSKYPAHAAVADWGMDMPKNQILGKPSGCQVSDKERRSRIRRLELYGLNERARTEILTLGKPGDSPAVDLAIASHMLNEGKVEDALKLLLSRYEALKSNVSYLQVLAKASSRAAESRLTIAAYDRIGQIAGKSKAGREARYLSAFSSYQFGDYDGALRRFTELKGLGSRQAKEAQWYAAWIKYLRGDFESALQELQALNSPRKPAARRARSEVVQKDRNRYWQAMCLLRLNRKEAASEIFLELAQDSGLGYYALASYQRLKVTGLLPKTFKLGAPGKAQAEEVEEEDDEETESEDSEMAEAPEASVKPEEKSAEKSATDTDKTEPSEEYADADDDDIPEDLVAAPLLANKNAGAPRRFDRAHALQLIGWSEMARRELAEVESQAHSLSERKRLLAEYQAAQLFHRSAQIADNDFVQERRRGGILQAKPLWEFAYPRAFEPMVLPAAKEFKVPEEFVWSIMKAESAFRFDARSPVGALGLMQLMPFTAKRVSELLSTTNFEVRSLLDPNINIRIGTRYLQRLFERFNGHPVLAAAAYNAGPHRALFWSQSFGRLEVDEFVEHIPFLETRNYVKKVLKNYQTYLILYRPNQAVSQLDFLPKPLVFKGAESLDVRKAETW